MKPPQSVIDTVARMNLTAGAKPGHGMIRIADRACDPIGLVDPWAPITNGNVVIEFEGWELRNSVLREWCGEFRDGRVIDKPVPRIVSVDRERREFTFG